MPNRRVIGLLRVSTDQQDVARQRTDIERLIRKFSLEVIRTLELHGVSGTAVLDNAQIQQVLRDLERPEVDGIAVSALDRLFRPKRYGHFAILDKFCDWRKVIWSAREGLVDPLTDEGYDKCISACGRAGAEWRELRRRTMDGKEVKRAAGKHVSGWITLPRGVAYDDATHKFSYQEPGASRVVRMAKLLLDGHSLHAIAAEVGGACSGIRKTLRNRIWAFGERIYPASEYRETPLIQKVIDKPLISLEMWQAVQERLDAWHETWRLSRRPPRFLLAGLLRCVCGKRIYHKARSRPTGHDTYSCSSRYPRGLGCGMRALWRERVEETVIRILREQFRKPCMALLLVDALERRERQAPTRDRQTAQERTRLEARRERILEQRADGLISREQCIERVSAVDRELAALRSEAPAPPQVDIARLAVALANHFAGFEKWPFDRQLKLLQWAIGDVVLNRNGIDSLTLKGGFLVEAAKIEATIQEANAINGVKVDTRSEW